VAKRYILQRKGLSSEETNRKCPAKNKTVQLSTPYTDPERDNAQCYGQADRQTTVSYQ